MTEFHYDLVKEGKPLEGEAKRDAVYNMFELFEEVMRLNGGDLSASSDQNSLERRKIFTYDEKKFQEDLKLWEVEVEFFCEESRAKNQPLVAEYMVTVQRELRNHRMSPEVLEMFQGHYPLSKSYAFKLINGQPVEANVHENDIDPDDALRIKGSPGRFSQHTRPMAAYDAAEFNREVKVIQHKLMRLGTNKNS